VAYCAREQRPEKRIVGSPEEEEQGGRGGEGGGEGEGEEEGEEDLKRLEKRRVR